MGIKIWNPKRLKVPTRFKPFAKKVAKTAKGLNKMLHLDALLQKAFKSVFNKKIFKRAGIATAVGVGVHYVMKYVETNSGCFLKDSSTVHCKVQAFSCCQKQPIQDLPFCPEGSEVMGNPCGDNFDEEKENSCCKFCSCDYFDCKPGQKMECQRPSVGEALTHFAHETASGITSLIPGFDNAIHLVWILILVWICFKVLLMFRKQG